MKICSSLNLGLVAAAAVAAGGILHVGCPTPQIESQFGLLNCGALGLLKIQEKYTAPNGTAIRELGDKILLNEWNTTSKEALDRFETSFPKNINWFEESEAAPCLNNSASRTFYNQMVNNISSIFAPFKSNSSSQSSDPGQCIQFAAGSSHLRSKAREMTRNRMCDQKAVKVLEARDRAEYGIEKVDFSYMVGKYWERLSTIVCFKGILCDIRPKVCEAIIEASQKTNALFDWVFAINR